MDITRRTFLRYCTISAAALGIDPLKLGLLREALANPGGPSVIWLKGSACDGCSISLLNRISDTAPLTAVNVLTDHINLIYHTNLMTFAGEPAAAALRQAYEAGGYVLVVEGGIPTAFDGHACMAYSYLGEDATMMDTVNRFGRRAAAVLSVGTCAAWGGIPASGSNPTQVVGVADLIGRPTINIAGCPAHPDWIVWAIVQLLIGAPMPLDTSGRPVALYRSHGRIHERCPRRDSPEAHSFGQDGICLENLGCRGKETRAMCTDRWNGKEGQGHWCIGVNAPCHGCVEPTFPGPESFYEEYDD